MRIAWFTTCQPKCPATAFSEAACPLLANSCEVVVHFPHAQAAWARAMVPNLPLVPVDSILSDQFQELLGNFDLAVYNLGPAPVGLETIRAVSQFRPGLVMLHDLLPGAPDTSTPGESLHLAITTALGVGVFSDRDLAIASSIATCPVRILAKPEQGRDDVLRQNLLDCIDQVRRQKPGLELADRVSAILAEMGAVPSLDNLSPSVAKTISTFLGK